MFFGILFILIFLLVVTLIVFHHWLALIYIFFLVWIALISTIIEFRAHKVHFFHHRAQLYLISIVDNLP